LEEVLRNLCNSNVPSEENFLQTLFYCVNALASLNMKKTVEVARRKRTGLFSVYPGIIIILSKFGYSGRARLATENHNARVLVRPRPISICILEKQDNYTLTMRMSWTYLLSPTYTLRRY
jgi:hypothetical protein